MGKKADKDQDTRYLVNEWLKLKPYIMWADWDIESDDRRNLAVDWFVGEMREFKRYERGVKDQRKKERNRAAAEYREQYARGIMTERDAILKNPYGTKAWSDDPNRWIES